MTLSVCVCLLAWLLHSHPNNANTMKPLAHFTQCYTFTHFTFLSRLFVTLILYLYPFPRPLWSNMSKMAVHMNLEFSREIKCNKKDERDFCYIKLHLKKITFTVASHSYPPTATVTPHSHSYPVICVCIRCRCKRVYRRFRCSGAVRQKGMKEREIDR